MTKHKASKSSPGVDIDIKDLPSLSLPEFPPIDREKIIPRYSAVLKRQDEDGIGLEDIDALQLELEALLSNVVLRKISLKDEHKIIINVEKYKGIVPKRKVPFSPGKRGASGGKDGRSAKKIKSVLSGKPPGQSLSSKIICVPKISKASDSKLSFDPLQNEQIRPLPENSKPILPKNETPNRFWAFVEPYCTPITQDDIKLLNDLIQTHGDLSEYYRIPPLGEHYATRWITEDLENERLKGSGEDEESGGSNSGIHGKCENRKEPPAFFDLTQRLVAGLMEENVMTPIEDNMETKNGYDAEEDVKKDDFIRSLNVSNANTLEARIRKELEEQGILEKSCQDDGPDEVLEELERCQTELKAVSAHNVKQLERLLAMAKEEMIRQELRKKLQEVDNGVMEAFKKISYARSKKKPPTKKEREFAWKSLKERELILKQLESI